MKRQKMLLVEWSENEQANYYVDKDEYSQAHDKATTVTLKSFSGEYIFDKKTKSVTLDTGTETRMVTVLRWKLYDAPTPD